MDNPMYLDPRDPNYFRKKDQYRRSQSQSESGPHHFTETRVPGGFSRYQSNQANHYGDAYEPFEDVAEVSNWKEFVTYANEVSWSNDRITFEFGCWLNKVRSDDSFSLDQAQNQSTPLPGAEAKSDFDRFRINADKNRWKNKRVIEEFGKWLDKVRPEYASYENHKHKSSHDNSYKSKPSRSHTMPKRTSSAYTLNGFDDRYSSDHPRSTTRSSRSKTYPRTSHFTNPHSRSYSTNIKQKYNYTSEEQPIPTYESPPESRASSPIPQNHREHPSEDSHKSKSPRRPRSYRNPERTSSSHGASSDHHYSHQSRNDTYRRSTRRKSTFTPSTTTTPRLGFLEQLAEAISSKPTSKKSSRSYRSH